VRVPPSHTARCCIDQTCRALRRSSRVCRPFVSSQVDAASSYSTQQRERATTVAVSNSIDMMPAVATAAVGSVMVRRRASGIRRKMVDAKRAPMVVQEPGSRAGQSSPGASGCERKNYFPLSPVLTETSAAHHSCQGVRLRSRSMQVHPPLVSRSTQDIT
jgi:hypothetical protein